MGLLELLAILCIAAAFILIVASFLGYPQARTPGFVLLVVGVVLVLIPFILAEMHAQPVHTALSSVVLHS